MGNDDTDGDSCKKEQYSEAALVDGPIHFYRAMLCIRGTSHGPVSVCVCLSQVGVLLKRLNVGSHKQHHTIAQGLFFSDAKDLRKIRPGSPPMRAPNAGGVGQNRPLLTNSRLYLENGTR